MALTEKYLNQLIADKTALANNLTTKGVTASSEETFTELVPKVLDIQAGGNEITKGFIVNEFDENGFATDVTIVGITKIPDYYFAYACKNTGWLSKIGANLHFSNDVNSIGINAFESCTNLLITELSGNITSISNNAFSGCTNLPLDKLPKNLTTLSYGAFYNCSSIQIKEIPVGITQLADNVFRNCTNIRELTCLGNIILMNSACVRNTKLSKFVLPNITSVPTLSNVDAFYNTPINDGSGYIYVPDTLVEDFKVASNWSTYASKIKGLSELPTE